MENRMHVPCLAQGVEGGSRDVAYPFGNNPVAGCGGEGEKLREYYQYGQADQDVTLFILVTVLIQLAEADNRSVDGA